MTKHDLILRDHAKTKSYQVTAKKYGVTRQYVYGIVRAERLVRCPSCGHRFKGKLSMTIP